MRFMNDYDIERALRRYSTGRTPNRLRAAITIARLANWTNRNSDGWAYWPKPCRAAAKIMALLEGTGSTTNDVLDTLLRTDATDAELKAALVPVKAFLTRHGVDHAEVIPSSI